MASEARNRISPQGLVGALSFIRHRCSVPVVRFADDGVPQVLWQCCVPEAKIAALIDAGAIYDSEGAAIALVEKDGTPKETKAATVRGWLKDHANFLPYEAKTVAALASGEAPKGEDDGSISDRVGALEETLRVDVLTEAEPGSLASRVDVLEKTEAPTAEEVGDSAPLQELLLLRALVLAPKEERVTAKKAYRKWVKAQE